MPTLGPLDNALAYQIYRLSRLLRQDLKGVLKQADLDLTSEQFFVIYRLFEKDGVPQAELADKSLGDFPNITRHIDSLEKKGLVERRSDDSDRRKYLIFLTESGRNQMEKATPFILAARDRVFGSLDDAERAQLRSVINAVQAALR